MGRHLIGGCLIEVQLYMCTIYVLGFVVFCVCYIYVLLIIIVITLQTKIKMQLNHLPLS